jgi:AbrB family looped-hinge helix DNA binding protein
MSKGQVTIPKDVRKVLGVSEGDRISFVVEDDTVRIVNAAVFAMQMLQNNLQGEAKKSRLESEDDIMQLVKDIRDEGNNDSSD